MQLDVIHKIGAIHTTADKKDTTKIGRANDAASPAATTTGSAMITSNDFLTLLVAEMKNQDPTSTADPNAYINQLVGVNSLQQLIQINSDLGNSSATSTGHSSGSNAAAVANALSQNYAATNRANVVAPSAASVGVTSKTIL